jgi:hypothetical protein
MGSLPPIVVVWGLLAVAVAGCISIGSPSMEEVSLFGLNPEPQTVQSPVRAFLGDGSVVVFPSGSRISSAAISGDGQRYDLHRTFSTAASPRSSSGASPATRPKGATS